jgi:hypothetical protein
MRDCVTAHMVPLPAQRRRPASKRMTMRGAHADGLVSQQKGRRGGAGGTQEERLLRNQKSETRCRVERHGHRLRKREETDRSGEVPVRVGYGQKGDAAQTRIRCRAGAGIPAAACAGALRGAAPVLRRLLRRGGGPARAAGAAAAGGSPIARNDTPPRLISLNDT